MIIINTIIFEESDNRGLVEYHLITHGTNQDELHSNAYVEEVDNEGESQSYYSLNKAGEYLQSLSNTLFISKLEDNYD